MKSSYLVIGLENNREDFADAWNIIKAVKNKRTASIKDYKNIYFYNVSKEVGGEGKLITQIHNEYRNMERATEEQMRSECGICLWIKDKMQNDIIEYQYLALILQNTEDVICYIYPDEEERIFEVYREVSCYFSSFVQRHNRRKRIWISRRRGNDDGIEMPGTELSNNSYKIIPLIEFEHKYCNLENWTRTVGQFLQDCDADHEIREMEPYQELSYRLRNARQNLRHAEAKEGASVKVLERKNKYNEEIKILQRKRNKLDEISRKSEDCRLLCQCINYFVMNPKSKNSDEIERYKSLFRNKDIQEILEDASFLAFFILCIQVYFMKNEAVLDVDEIRMLLINAEELAEGIVQLLENLYHSSEKRGLFSIRIHEKKTEKNYLSSIYPDYSSETSDSLYDFEFRILDYSRSNIVKSFKNNNKESEREVPEDFRVRDFFECGGEDGFWKEYNKKPENLVHHYGLQIFSTIISNNGGLFRVISSSKTSVNLKNECYYNGEGKFGRSKHIPGTEYDILLPMRYDVKPLNPSIDADIQYQFDMKKQFHVGSFDSKTAWEKVIGQDDGLIDGQSRKEKRINDLKDGVQEWLEKQEVGLGIDNEKATDEIVTVISAKDWGRNKLEILCKSLVLCLIKWQPKNNQGFNVIIKDCSSNDFISIARIFAIFYSKGTLSHYMDRLQIYLSGEDQSEEFIIAGNSLSSLFTMASKLTLVRGIQPYCLKSIEYILRKFQADDSGTDAQNLQLVPFDILELPSTTETLFEQAVKRVLESDIQRYSFGCKVRHTHMRIGSKLHISEFFEAELLFHNNYYVARFALLILRRLEKELQKDRPIMFVGYETYSELLLYEIVTNLNAKGFDSSYMIYEQRQEGTFRYYDSVQYLKEKKNLAFILIVPINSSMTTHSKLQAWLYQEIEKAGVEGNICIAQQYAIILIRSSQEGEDPDDMEEDYYASMQKGMVRATFLPEDRNTIQYFVCINTKWSDPLLCEFCFPHNSMLKERPLIETNRSSIIPIQMLGIREKDILKLEGESKEVKASDEENQKRVNKLGDALIYKHIVRNGNHFMFYFELEKYFIQNRDEIIKWLQGIKGCKKKSEGIVYDVIVAPLHYSNAGFVAEVNYHLYGNAALVLNFEVDKEFRENVRTKYSNVIGLYKKLIDMGNPAELRFHFVDDNIITGNTFLRAKSLFASLLPSGHSKVKVKVFDDIIVLLNRMSEASIMNCVQDRNDYHAYVFLNISSMRNHEDACSLCKVVENSEILRDQSATNRMYEYWDKKIVYHQVKKPEECRGIYLKEEETRRRAVRRMLCTHEINEKLKRIGYLKNETDQVKAVMIQLMSERKDSKDAIEWIISYIKIFSRPFVSFRKSCLEASFAIMLELIEFITGELCESDSKLKKSKFTKYGDLRDLCCAIRDAATKWKQGDKVFSLFLTLMQRLSVLGSNYVIRKENISKLFSTVEIFIQKGYISKEKRQKFIQKYISIVKRIVCLSSDENKCIYLEHIILFGEEYGNGVKEKEIDESEPKREFAFSLPQKIAEVNDKEFVEILFIENTRVLYDGIHDLNHEMTEGINLDSLSRQLKDKYYFKNFKRLLTYYHFINEKEGEIIFEEGCAESVLAMVKLYRMLCETGREQEERDVESFYNNLLKYVETITKTNAQILIPAVSTETGTIVYKKQQNMEIGREESDYNREKFVYDTYAISESEDKKKKVLIKYRNYIGKEYSEKEKNQMNEVYLELLFPRNASRLQIMIAIKCIMVFRDLILKNMEKDFSNNLMQKWGAEQFFKKNMKLERASDHSDKDELAQKLRLISEGMSNWEIEHQRALFDLVINSYIARFNVQLLADACPEGENLRCSFEYVYRKQLKALLDVLHEIRSFKILDELGEEQFSQKVLKSRIRMCENNRKCERLSIRRLSIIVIELVLSAIKYSDTQIIQIYREKNYLVAKNTFVSNKDIAVIKQEAHDSSSRKKEGISLAVIKELVDSFYLLDKDNGVIIDAEEVEGKKYYLVKLPIFMD